MLLGIRPAGRGLLLVLVLAWFWRPHHVKKRKRGPCAPSASKPALATYRPKQICCKSLIRTEEGGNSALCTWCCRPHNHFFFLPPVFFVAWRAAGGRIECRISKDEGGRGIGDVVINGELLKAGRHIASMNKGETVVILSGCE